MELELLYELDPLNDPRLAALCLVEDDVALLTNRRKLARVELEAVVVAIDVAA